MTVGIMLLVGTRRGAFLLESDRTRRDWALKGPLCEAWPINHMVADPATGTLYAGGGNEWFGPAVWRSRDRGRSWTHSSAGLAYAAGEEPVKTVWSLAVNGRTLYAGVQPAGLFRSDDDGESWTHVVGLREHPTRPNWQPGGAGLILHSIVPHPGDPRALWVAMSAVGVFHTADAGASWEPRNRGTRNDYMPEEQRYPEFGQCVHSLVMAAGMPERLYQQNHCGMYRSDDGGRRWDSIERGLPSTFGFPAAAHPRDPETLYLLPLNGDTAGRYVPDGAAAVWRTSDGGASWAALRQGLPQQNAFFGVLRQAMAADALAPAGIYFGTNTGALFASNDEGRGWRQIAQHLPTISSVETVLVPD
ncbi:MAG: WD40/YVTN/BNR-like repeat-containing protein [Stellaceae bacterium]